ncbi:hypothetical protein SAMN05518846_104405 [Brevibacillus centrosporus]|uniref:Uncharacterized protein n=1 Tax=Brevibacillus centrosporus TaxID=54910 RepID=A0A1I3T364_9BACL|nr:hypothetical protein SAMN05518846_104405 [Brevibacillus centrosporus]
MGALGLQFSVGRFFAPVTFILSEWVPPMGGETPSSVNRVNFVLTDGVEFLRIVLNSIKRSYPERWRVWPDEARQPSCSR